MQQEFEPGDVIVEQGKPADSIVLIAHGKVEKIGKGKYGDERPRRAGRRRPLQLRGRCSRTTTLGLHRQGGHDGHGADAARRRTSRRSSTSTRRCRAPRGVQGAAGASRRTSPARPRSRSPSGHEGEPTLPGTFVDYEPAPREYELSVAQTVLRIHTRVADLYNEPMNQTEQQLRLTSRRCASARSTRWSTTRDFGLLHNCDLKQRIRTRTGPPTPDDFDELLVAPARRRSSCSRTRARSRRSAASARKRGVYPATSPLHDATVPSWRGVPLLPCNKIPITEHATSSVIVMRTGEDNQGVIGLHQTGIPGRVEPGLSVRFMGINEKAIINYLVTTYFSAAVLVPDALGVLEDCEIGAT